MIGSNNLAQAHPETEKITLKEILPTIVGKYIIIILEETEDQNTNQEEQLVQGVLKVTKQKLVIIGTKSYRLDTPVTGIFHIKDPENNTSLCEMCPFDCKNNPEYCKDIIGRIIGRKA